MNLSLITIGFFMAFETSLSIDEKRVFSKYNNLVGSKTDMNISIISTNNIADIKEEWLFLEAFGLESPGMSYDFIRLWVENFNIKKQDQKYYIVLLDDEPIVGMAFECDRHLGINVYMPFGEYHVGSGAPLIDRNKMQSLSEKERIKLWKSLKKSIKNVDIAFFRSVPKYEEKNDIFASIGVCAPADFLYRAQFENWQACDKEQRTRSRRKHDKQHFKKLSSFGELSFEEVSASSEKAKHIIDVMFEQRAKRFAVQGIKNPFLEEERRKFYYKAGALKGNLSGVLHVLYLNKQIIAVRYNLVHQDKMFCLISSMSEDKKIQTGAPGKHCLLEVMQSVFDNGISYFDMGSGLTDEKRHWCNKVILLKHYYMPLTPLGYIVTFVHRLKKTLRFKVKNNQKLNIFAKKIRSILHDLN